MQYQMREKKMINNNLIFDLGFHNGDDTDFYLKKGFKVVSVEANPNLISEGMKRFSKEIENGQLKLLHNAIADKIGQIEFYIHLKNSDWSSCFKNIAQSDGSVAKKVTVTSITINELFKQFGVPRYMKVDIEGFDIVVARELCNIKNKPAFVSFETNRKEFAEIYSYLFVAGYEQFQLVNQRNNPDRIIPFSSSEGKDIRYKFSKYSSGLFGEDLPHDKWLDINNSISNYVKYKTCKEIDNIELGLGWMDLHAKLIRY
jgi:FkbM family methyltransferase